jgi:outer membrane protein OmpA-like peptidoglycan-associated protein
MTTLAPVHIVSNPPPAPPPERTISIEPFGEGSYALSPKLEKEIQRMALTIQKRHYKTVDLTGYTDNVFTPAFNVTLNQNRALAVSARLSLDLQTLNVSGVVISIVPGYGVVLVATNTTAQGRAENRRVVATLKAT